MSRSKMMKNVASEPISKEAAASKSCTSFVAKWVYLYWVMRRISEKLAQFDRRATFDIFLTVSMHETAVTPLKMKIELQMGPILG